MPGKGYKIPKDQTKKQMMRGHNLTCWLKEEAHQNKAKYNKKDRKSNKINPLDYGDNT